MHGGRRRTERNAVALVSAPNGFVAMHLYAAPLSAGEATGVVYVLESAPGMFTPFFCHRYARGIDPTALARKTVA